jgi:hypothetical protein
MGDGDLVDAHVRRVNEAVFAFVRLLECNPELRLKLWAIVTLFVVGALVKLA